MDTPYTSTFVRTISGQHEILAEALELTDGQRRLLLLVNGYTPLVELASRLSEVQNLPLAVEQLVDTGLLAAVKNEKHDRTGG